MSAFDDEFGLFGEGEQSERKSTLGARKIASNETIIDDVEPEDEGPPRRGTPNRMRRPADRPRREAADPAASQRRASELLEFLAKKLVAKPEAVTVDHFPAEGGEEAAIELVVDPEDIGKVIGRSGRVAQALRTVVRATAEGRIGVEILDTDELKADQESDAAEDDSEDDSTEDDSAEGDAGDA